MPRPRNGGAVPLGWNVSAPSPAAWLASRWTIFSNNFEKAAIGSIYARPSRCRQSLTPSPARRHIRADAPGHALWQPVHLLSDKANLRGDMLMLPE